MPYSQGKRRLKVSENRVLRRIFGTKRKEVARDWRRLRNEELHNLYVSSNIIRMIKPRRMRCVGHGTDEKSERKRQLGRPRCRWKDIIRMDK
jgi:hypothetical protein